MRTPKGRAKRSRATAGTPSNDRNLPEGRKLRKTRRGNNGLASASPARLESSVSKRKIRPAEESDPVKANDKGLCSSATKRSRSSSNSHGNISGTDSPTLLATIECPEMNCMKRYRHINGLRYHQSHAHQQALSTTEDEKCDTDDDDDNSDCHTTNAHAEAIQRIETRNDYLVSNRAGRAKAKEQRLQRDIAVEMVEKVSAMDESMHVNSCSSQTKGDYLQKMSEHHKDTDNIANRATNGSVTHSINGVDGIVTSPASVCAHFDNASSSGTQPTPCVQSSSGDTLLPVKTSKPSDVSSSIACCMPLNMLTFTTVSSKKDDGFSMAIGLSVCKTTALSGKAPYMSRTSGVSVPGSHCSTIQAPVISVPPATTTTTTLLPSASAQVESVVENKDVKVKGKLVSKPHVSASPVVTSDVSVSASFVLNTSTLLPVKQIPLHLSILGDCGSAGLSPDLKEKRRLRKKDKDNFPGQTASPQQQEQLMVVGDCMAPDRPAIIKCSNVSILHSKDGSYAQSNDLANIPDGQLLPGSTNDDSPINNQRDITNSLDPFCISVPTSLLKGNITHDNDSENFAESKSSVIDDVQSPAYSDISDANDSSSPQQQVSPTNIMIPRHGDNPCDNSVVSPSPYGLYYYNRSFLSPHHNSVTPLASPTSGQNFQLSTDKGSINSSLCGDSLTSTICCESAKSYSSNPDSKDTLVSKCAGNSKQDVNTLSSQQTVYQHSDYQHKLIQFYSQIRQMPQHAQYQYLAAYGMLDSYPHCLLNLQDSHCRRMGEEVLHQRKFSEQQHTSAGKRQKLPESSRKQRSPYPPSSDRPGSSNSNICSGDSQKTSHSQNLHHMQDDLFHESMPSVDTSERLGYQEQALKQKQDENHQIMKENIELKLHMDRTRNQELADIKLKQEDGRRLIFTQQRQLESQHITADKHSHDGHGKFSDWKGISCSSHSPHNPGHLPVSKSMKSDHIKKELIDTSNCSKDPVSKVSYICSSEHSRHNCGSDMTQNCFLNATRSHKPDCAGSVGMSVQSCLPSSSTGGVPISDQFSPYPFPVLAAHYSMHIDPNHPMYRPVLPHMLGYAPVAPPSNAYVHPSTVGLQMPVTHTQSVAEHHEPEGLKSDINKPFSCSLAGEDVGAKVYADTPASQFYSHGVHKIHELAQDQHIRPDRTSPSVPLKSMGVEVTISDPKSSNDKQRGISPPTQRHHHTHHHTHVLSHEFYSPESAFGVGESGFSSDTFSLWLLSVSLWFLHNPVTIFDSLVLLCVQLFLIVC